MLLMVVVIKYLFLMFAPNTHVFFLMNTKSQVLVAFERLKVFSKNQTRFKLFTIQTDNAKEFLALQLF